MRKNFVIYLTFFLLISGLVVSVVWLFRSEGDSRFEPGLTVLGLFATMTGIFAERFASSYERKQELIIAFYRELIKNEAILNNSQFKLDPEQLSNPIVFPRLIASVTETAISSGIFEERKYRDVFFCLNEWQDFANEFNHRLDITELRTFTNLSIEELRSFYTRLVNSGEIERGLKVSQFIAHKLEEKYIKKTDVKLLGLEAYPTEIGSDYRALFEPERFPK